MTLGYINSPNVLITTAMHKGQVRVGREDNFSMPDGSPAFDPSLVATIFIYQASSKGFY